MKPITSVQAVQAYSDIEMPKVEPKKPGVVNIVKINTRYGNCKEDNRQSLIT